MSLPSLIQDQTAAFVERTDQLTSLDAATRGVITHLYAWARSKQGGPLCLAAATMLNERVRPGRPVFLATGWPDRPHISPLIGESDGPPGTAALARAIHRGLGAVPVVIIEEELLPGMVQVMQAASFRVLSLDEAVRAAESSAPIHAAAVLSFPKNIAEATARTKELFNDWTPDAVIAVEKGGMNDLGYIHTSRGDDTTDAIAKADPLFAEARARGIATIGIGDGGNEIGMGVIEEEIRQHIPFGAQAKDPAKGGTAPHGLVDVLVAAAISNWGAYGVAACLAFLRRRPHVFHDATVESRMLRISADASFIDGATGFVDPSADGLASPVHEAFVTLMGEVVRQALART